MAATAWAPPARKMAFTPATFAAQRISGLIFPSLPGGVHMTISLQPASRAGIPSIRTVENNGAVPPGMYSPTFSMGTSRYQQRIPGAVSMTSAAPIPARWNFSMFDAADRIAFFMAGLT